MGRSVEIDDIILDSIPDFMEDLSRAVKYVDIYIDRECYDNKVIADWNKIKDNLHKFETYLSEVENNNIRLELEISKKKNIITQLSAYISTFWFALRQLPKYDKKMNKLTDRIDGIIIRDDSFLEQGRKNILYLIGK